MNTGLNKAERASSELRLRLMNAISAHIDTHGWTQAEVAKRVLTTAARISDMKRGYEDRFSVDSLLVYAYLLDLPLTVRIDGKGFHLTTAATGGAYAST